MMGLIDKALGHGADCAAPVRPYHIEYKTARGCVVYDDVMIGEFFVGADENEQPIPRCVFYRTELGVLVFRDDAVTFMGGAEVREALDDDLFIIGRARVAVALSFQAGG